MAKLSVPDTNNQFFGAGTTSNPVYGRGARGYGSQGGAVRGRKAQVQFREQNSGMAPAEDYRVAEFLPGLWDDLDRNGSPVVMAGGTVVGVAKVLDSSVPNGKGAVFAHKVAAANAGVPQKLLYTQRDVGIAIDIDSYINAGAFDETTVARVTAAGASTNFLDGNKPLAYNPTNSNSSAWQDVYTNQQFEWQVTMKTQWLCMYPVDDIFIYGGTLTGTDLVSAAIDNSTAALPGGSIEGANRNSLGFDEVNISTNDTANGVLIQLQGIQAGDLVMPNPYLPGKLLSVNDFVTLATADDAGTIYTGGLAGFMTAEIGAATYADVKAYAMDHVVGRCFKRQPRGTMDANGLLTNVDITTDIYRYDIVVPGLGLSGGGDPAKNQGSQGTEANQDSALKFAGAMPAGTSLDVVFINFNIK